MNPTRVFSDLQIAEMMADAAAAAIRPLFRAEHGLEDKADNSPVTQADRNAERAMREILAEHRGGDGIIGEEFEDENRVVGRTWVLDPLDGTRAFASGFPMFGTLVALLQDGAPTLGLCHMPVTTERFWGDRTSATGPHGAVSTSAIHALSQARLRLTSHQMFSADELSAVDALAASCRFMHAGGDCYNYCLLAGGHCELIVEADLKPYDIMAAIPIVTGAGGLVTDWRGNPVSLNSSGQVLASANAVLHQTALAHLTPLSKD